MHDFRSFDAPGQVPHRIGYRSRPRPPQGGRVPLDLLQLEAVHPAVMVADLSSPIESARPRGKVPLSRRRRSL